MKLRCDLCNEHIGDLVTIDGRQHVQVQVDPNRIGGEGPDLGTEERPGRRSRWWTDPEPIELAQPTLTAACRKHGPRVFSSAHVVTEAAGGASTLRA